MPHTYTNGIVTFYEDAGEGPVVVLIHGYAGDIGTWQYQVPALVEAGFRAVRYDVRGHGRSMIAPEGYTWENYSSDLGDLLDRVNVERPTTESLAVDAVHIADLLNANLPNARQTVMADCWHLPPLEYPDEFNEALVSFIREVRMLAANWR